MMGMHPFFPSVRAPHAPRLRLGTTVVQRQTWHVTSAELGEPRPTGLSAALVTAIERMRRDRGIPRWVFARASAKSLATADLYARGLPIAEALGPRVAAAPDPAQAVRTWKRSEEPARWVEALLGAGRPSAAWVATRAAQLLGVEGDDEEARVQRVRRAAMQPLVTGEERPATGNVMTKGRPRPHSELAIVDSTGAAEVMGKSPLVDRRERPMVGNLTRSGTLRPTKWNLVMLEKAIAETEAVLRQQPSNAEAKQRLHELRLDLDDVQQEMR
jgi:hypothetical protein